MQNEVNVGDDISIVIPMFNASQWLSQLIQSLEAQTMSPKEVIIVDSSPTNESQELLKEAGSFLKIRYYHTDFAYPGHARNIGVEYANTKWIAFLDCRTIPEPFWLEEMASLASKTNVDFVNALLTCDANTRFKQTLLAVTYGNTPVQTVPGSLILRSVFMKSGGFLPDVRAGEDIEWRCRLKEMGVTMTTVSMPLLKYCGFPASLLEATRKWYVFSFANARIDVYNLQKKLYFTLLLLMIFLLVNNWNSFFAQWSLRSPFYIPHITKFFLVCISFSYFIFRSIWRPRTVEVKYSFLFPFRWIEVGLLGIYIDIVKAPGLIWGAIVLWCKKIGLID